MISSSSSSSSDWCNQNSEERARRHVMTSSNRKRCTKSSISSVLIISISIAAVVFLSVGTYLAVTQSQEEKGRIDSPSGITEQQQSQPPPQVQQVQVQEENSPFSFEGLILTDSPTLSPTLLSLEIDQTNDNNIPTDNEISSTKMILSKNEEVSTMSPTMLRSGPKSSSTSISVSNPSANVVLTTSNTTYNQAIRQQDMLKVISNISSTSYANIAAVNWIVFNDPLNYCFIDCNSKDNKSTQIVISKEKFIQRYVMTLFYYSTGMNEENGERIQDKHPLQPSLFLTGIDVCQWMSPSNNNKIECNEEGYITTISLSRMNLTGVIPSELSQLTYLKKLELSGNHFTGNIPSSLGTLHDLYYLDISYNSLSGSVLPSDFLSNSVGVDGNSFSSLEYLYLSHNNLQGTLSGSIRNLKKLQYFWMEENDVGGSITSSLFELEHLESLIVYGNKLTGTIPRPIKSLQHLTYADFSYNQLNGRMNRGVFESKSIEYLYLNNNKMTGTIPDVTSEAGMDSKLQHLWLKDNILDGSIPSRLGRLAKLGDLLLQNNNLNGTMPNEICNLRADTTNNQTSSIDNYSLHNLEADCISMNETTNSSSTVVKCICCTLCE